MNKNIFPIGQPNDDYAEFFSGQSYLQVLSDKQLTIFNVTFEPGCRNNWHIHHAQSGGGQILLVTSGKDIIRNGESLLKNCTLVMS